MKQRILVVDDELGPRESFRFLLKDKFEVCLATSGEEALARVEQERYDMVFLDVKMPGIDGIQALTEMRRLRPDLPIVLVTAYASLETAAKGTEMGAMELLIKPFSQRDVHRLVDRALATGAVGR